MNNHQLSFFNYVLLKENKSWLFSAIVIAIIYFIVLRILFPVPSFYADSYTWIGAAVSGQFITFRPVGYSKLLAFCKFFSASDIALIAAQFFSNLIANLFLFFTCTYFFPFRRVYKQLLYLLVIINPFYLLYSNYISSDPFFNCFTVVWFTILIWIMYKPSWTLILVNLIVLAALFELRYNAIFFPAVFTLALMLSRQTTLNKIAGIAAAFVTIVVIIIITTNATKSYTGTKTFSAFSGWQMANNAVHIMQHNKIDTSAIHDGEAKAVAIFTLHFFDTTKIPFPDSGATSFFMWHPYGPLKKYMQIFSGRNKSYFKTWNALGPVYNKFGEAIILQNPRSYLKYFVLPNAKAYIFPPLEIYKTFMEDKDTIAAEGTRFFHYKTNKTPRHHPFLYAIVFAPVQYLFMAMNIFFLLMGGYYLLSGKYNRQLRLYNYTLLCFAAFFIMNCFFIVLLAPSVLRYHIFILTISFPIMLYLVQQLQSSAAEQFLIIKK